MDITGLIVANLDKIALIGLPTIMFAILKGHNSEKKDNDVTQLIKTCNYKAQQTKATQNKTIF